MKNVPAVISSIAAVWAVMTGSAALIPWLQAQHLSGLATPLVLFLLLIGWLLTGTLVRTPKRPRSR